MTFDRCAVRNSIYLHVLSQSNFLATYTESILIAISMPWKNIGEVRKVLVFINELISGTGHIKPQGNKLANVLKLMANVGNKILYQLVA